MGGIEYNPMKEKQTMRREPLPIIRKFRLIHNAFKEGRNRQLNRYDLTSSQMDVLIYLRINEGKEIHQREIENWLRLKNPTVTGILNRLEEKGFIVRKTNPNDRRFRQIELTEKSIRILDEAKEEMETRDERIYSCMTEEERQILEELLDRILSHITESKEEKEC